MIIFIEVYTFFLIVIIIHDGRSRRVHKHVPIIIKYLHVVAVVMVNVIVCGICGGLRSCGGGGLDAFNEAWHPR